MIDIKKILRKLRSLFVKTKLYLDRAKNYLSYFNFLMLMLVTVRSFGLKSSLALPFAILLFGISLLLGYLDVHFKIYSEEQRVNTELNPIIIELKELLKKL